MRAAFREITEQGPGPVWARLFAEYWPAYRRWWGREGLDVRPSYLASKRALDAHMPEIVPLWKALAALAGGGDLEARFLSYYCPPPYLSGCSQAIWPGAEPMLVRNYDYDPDSFDFVILRTDWEGRRVIGTSDGLFGLVDGVNDLGLAISLTFGGRSVVGTGFGVPLILRYILQICATTEEAVAALRRIPCHMSYNVTVVDRNRAFATAQLAPDRPAAISHAAVATNHQSRVELVSHAQMTATVERERFLLQRLSLHSDSKESFIRSFLRPPLYSTAFAARFGTLYTASLEPAAGRFSLHWPGASWALGLHETSCGEKHVHYPTGGRVDAG